MSFMCGGLDDSVGAVKVIDAIQQAESGGDAVRLAVSIEGRIKGGLSDFKLLAGLGVVARGEGSGELVSDFLQVDFGSHVLGGARTSFHPQFIPSTSFNQKFRQGF